jgi:hypothetical protein
LRRGLIIGIGLVVAAACAIVTTSVLVFLASDIDPLDQFELVGLSSNPQGQKHAAVYRYHHSNSSANVAAIWILSGPPPVIGSKDSVAGPPALVWLGGPDQLRIRWQPQSERFLVEVKGPVEIGSSDNGFYDCYFQDPAPANLLCVEPKRIDLRVLD